MADTATTSTIVTLTPKAQEMVRQFLAEESDPTGKVLRIGVTSGGCSGFSYEIAIDLKQDDDAVQPFEGFDCVVNPVSVQFLQGVTVDYVDTVGQAGFTFSNPQAKSSCGCGNSFNV